MKGMGQFDPEFYSQYRPLYPKETFAGFETKLKERGFSAPFTLADVGCGTGHSIISILRGGIDARVYGIDPDPKMLDRAKLLLQDTAYIGRATLSQGTGESTGLKENSISGILVGSAFHWMDLELALKEFLRILKPGGIVRVFEYQFPKAKDLPELNEWIRRQFNLYWKAPGQTPRGSLSQLMDVFRKNEQFEYIGEGKPEMVHELGEDELAGLIFSQSRVIHFQKDLSDEQRLNFRETVKLQLKQYLRNETKSFDFKLSWFEFGLLAPKV